MAETPVQTTSSSVPWRIQGAVYGSGLFANSSLQLYNVIIPLWVGLLTESAFLIGVVLGVRQVLPMLFSIHAGALMDRLGARRVTLWLAGLAVCIPPLYPLLPWIPALVVLQMLGGFAVMLCWVGVQSFIGHAMKGQPVYAGRLTFSTRIGVFAGPPLVGACWDLAGAWGAFGFMTFWAAGMFAAMLCLPPGISAQETKPGATPPRTGLRGLVPDWRDYAAAFSLLAIPAVALVMGVTTMRHAGTGIQCSFYVYYLNEIGITGTAIGWLFSMIGIFGAVGSLCVGRFTRVISQRMLLLVAVAASVILVSIVPMLGTFFTLAIAISLRGMATGIAQSMEIALTSQGVGPAAQGRGAALRLTIGRIAAVIVPIIMGAVVEFAGLELSFYLLGGIIVVGILAMAILLPNERNPG